MSSSLEKANIRRMKKYLSLFTEKSAAGHPYRYCSYGTGSKQYGHNCYNRRSGKFRNVEIDPGGGYNIRRKHWNHNNSPAHVFQTTNFSYIIIGLGLLIAFFSKRRTPANMGWALTGLGIMFAGLNILNLGVPYIKEMTIFMNSSEFTDRIPS